MTSKPYPASLLLLAISLAAAGCAADVNPVRDLAVASGITGGEPKPAPDFVSRSRQTETEYIPVGTSAPKRPQRIKSKTEISGAEAELDAVRTQTQARGADAQRKPGQ